MAADLGPKISELYSSLNYPSADKFYAALRQRGYVLRKEDVAAFVRGVGVRQVFAPRRAPAQKSGHIAAADLDSRWFADLTMPAPGGEKYILVLQDVFARALRDKKPETVNKAVVDVLRESGRAPESIETDEGPQFARLPAIANGSGSLGPPRIQRTSMHMRPWIERSQPSDRGCRSA